MTVQGPWRPFPAWRGSPRGLARTLPAVGSEVGEPGPEEDARFGNSGAEVCCRFSQAPGNRFLQAPGGRFLADGCPSEAAPLGHQDAQCSGACGGYFPVPCGNRCALEYSHQGRHFCRQCIANLCIAGGGPGGAALAPWPSSPGEWGPASLIDMERATREFLAPGRAGCGVPRCTEGGEGLSYDYHHAETEEAHRVFGSGEAWEDAQCSGLCPGLPGRPCGRRCGLRYGHRVYRHWCWSCAGRPTGVDPSVDSARDEGPEKIREDSVDHGKGLPGAQ